MALIVGATAVFVAVYAYLTWLIFQDSPLAYRLIADIPLLAVAGGLVYYVVMWRRRALSFINELGADQLAKELERRGLDVTSLRPLYPVGNIRVYALTVDGREVYGRACELIDAAEKPERFLDMTEKPKPAMAAPPERGWPEESELGEKIERAGADASSLGGLFERDGYNVYRLAVDGETAPSVYRKLRHAFRETGYWPLILGGDDDIIYYTQDAFRDDQRSVEAELERARNLDLDEWIDSTIIEEDDVRGEPDEEFIEGPEGFTVHADLLTREPWPRVYIGLFPVSDPCELPAFLMFGGWNECPPPHVHCALFKRWAERHGAEPVGITGDTVEMIVEKKPVTEEEALALAREQYAYCPDLVEQGLGNLETLAVTLEKNPLWSFWWD